MRLKRSEVSHLLTVLALFITCSCAVQAADEAPHIIFLMADDIGFGDVEVKYPDSDIPTPNINRLAEQGRNFTNGHTTSAVCTPDAIQRRDRPL